MVARWGDPVRDAACLRCISMLFPRVRYFRARKPGVLAGEARSKPHVVRRLSDRGGQLEAFYLSGADLAAASAGQPGRGERARAVTARVLCSRLR